MEQTEKKRDYVLPASILIAALLVSISLVYNAGKRADTTPSGDAANADANAAVGGADTTVRISPVTAEDHILGDANAPVKIVEYSDLECPYCKRFHYTLQQAVAAYNGKVAWVYRHSPIDELHPKARKEAEATECAAEQGGNEAFWKYMDRMMELTPSNNGLDPAKLPTIATDVGLDAAAFQTCLSSGKFASKVEAQRLDAVAAGGGGTPYSVVVNVSSGKTYVVPGAYAFTSNTPNEPTLKQVLDEALL
jgi:protein-disulfide isomerase